MQACGKPILLRRKCSAKLDGADLSVGPHHGRSDPRELGRYRSDRCEFTCQRPIHGSHACAVLRSANLSGAKLQQADLSGANLEFASLITADLTGASLRYALLGSQPHCNHRHWG